MNSKVSIYDGWALINEQLLENAYKERVERIRQAKQKEMNKGWVLSGFSRPVKPTVNNLTLVAENGIIVKA